MPFELFRRHHKIRELAQAAQARGWSYLGISDHSTSAAYAGGLDRDAVFRQHDEIDALNQELHGFRVLKGIEADILADGTVDYADDLLDRFDYVIGSIHSRFSMGREQMTERILKAMSDPRLTILGHPTGRLILTREPFPVDMDAIIEKAAESGVALELNCDPHRLDLDWRLVQTGAGTWRDDRGGPGRPLARRILVPRLRHLHRAQRLARGRRRVERAEARTTSWLLPGRAGSPPKAVASAMARKGQGPRQPLSQRRPKAARRSALKPSPSPIASLAIAREGPPDLKGALVRREARHPRNAEGIGKAHEGTNRPREPSRARRGSVRWTPRALPRRPL